MDTPGHVSEGDGQEEDENKWGAGAGEGRKEKKKRLASKLYQCRKKNGESGVTLERKEEHVLERDCVKVWRAIGHTVQLSCDI